MRMKNVAEAQTSTRFIQKQQGDLILHSPNGPPFKHTIVCGCPRWGGWPPLPALSCATVGVVERNRMGWRPDLHTILRLPTGFFTLRV